jgi:outer membrane biosynthesis protein TonB
MSDDEIGDVSDSETEVAEALAETQAAVELPTLAAEGVAWSLEDAGEDHPRSRWRNRLVWAGLATLLCATSIAVGGFSMELLAHRAQPPAETVAVPRPEPAPTTTPTPTAAPAPPPPPPQTTVITTVEVIPPQTVTVRPPQPTQTSADEERLLYRLRSWGYVIYSEPMVLQNARAICTRLQHGESPEQAEKEMVAATNATMAFASAVTSAVMIEYPNGCAHAFSDGD